MKKKIVLMICLVVAFSICVSAQTRKTLILPRPTPTPVKPPPGNITLIENYTHIKEFGVDASVGKISKPDGMTIRYLAGSNAEFAASRACNVKNYCLWYKGQIVNGLDMWIGLTKEGELIATFPKERANFYAITKSPEDIADFLLMVLTYKAEPSTLIKSEIRKVKQK